MSVTAVPTLTVGGQPIAGTLAGTLRAIDELRLTWGRAGVLEQPTPASLSLTVRDTTPGATFARRKDLIGQPLVLGWTCSDGSSGVNFRGRITDAAATPRPGAVAGRGFDVALAASSVEVDLANYKVAAGSSFPAETFAARRARLAAMLPAGTFTGGVVLPNRFDVGLQDVTTPETDLDTYTAAPDAAAGGKDLLTLLRELFASTAPFPLIYDPTTDRLRHAGRRRFTYNTGITLSAKLIPSADHGGRYIAASLSGHHLDAAHTGYAGSLQQALENRLTRIELQYLDSTASYAQRTVAAGTADTGNEPVIGRRVLSVTTIQGLTAKATQLAGLYADLASNEGRSRRLGAVSYSTAREPFRDGSHAALLLAGAEAATALFLRGSWLPQLGSRPLVGVLGATVRYARGQWSIDLQPAPVFVDPAGANWWPVTVAKAAAAGVKLSDLDPSVTLGDYGSIDVGAGYTEATAPSYVGNPL